LSWASKVCQLIKIDVCPAGIEAEPQVPYIHAPELMEPASRQPFSGGADKHAKFLVIIQMGKHPNFVRRLSCSSIKPAGSRQYSYASGEPRTGMGQEELCDIMAEYFKSLKQLEGRLIAERVHQGQQSGCPKILVLDREPTHRTQALTDLCHRHNVKVMLLPPRSPDLSPLDSSFFGVVKRRVREASCGLGASAKFDMLEAALRDTAAEQYICHYPQKLMACIEAKGGYCVRLYERLKKVVNEVMAS
jgi:DDE superfamily endonuclease